MIPKLVLPHSKIEHCATIYNAKEKKDKKYYFFQNSENLQSNELQRSNLLQYNIMQYHGWFRFSNGVFQHKVGENCHTAVKGISVNNGQPVCYIRHTKYIYSWKFLKYGQFLSTFRTTAINQIATNFKIFKKLQLYIWSL